MMIVPFEAKHADSIRLQAAQMDGGKMLSGAELERAGPAITGIIGDEVVFCIGKVQQWEHRWVVWALLSESARKHMVAITRAVKRCCALLEGDGRVEIIVRSDFPEAHRWVKMMGFTHHHHEEKFLPDRSDADIYVRFA